MIAAALVELANRDVHDLSQLPAKLAVNNPCRNRSQSVNCFLPTLEANVCQLCTWRRLLWTQRPPCSRVCWLVLQHEASAELPIHTAASKPSGHLPAKQHWENSDLITAEDQAITYTPLFDDWPTVCLCPHICMSQCVATGSVHVHDPLGLHGGTCSTGDGAVAHCRPTILLSRGNGVYKRDTIVTWRDVKLAIPTGVGSGTIQLN